MVRSWWIVWRSGYRNQATVTVVKPKEYNDTLTEVLAKADLQPYLDELKRFACKEADINGPYTCCAISRFLKAWESANS